MSQHSRPNDYIDIGRMFRELTNEERSDPTILAQLHELGVSGDIDWDALLESQRVVILAEAGSGKTRELKERCRLINDQGGTAFFVPIEVLHAETLEDYLAMEDERFEKWHSSGGTAWFFLDAVDELKLTPGKVDLALGRVAKALNSAKDRARIILTCRPTDWRPADLDSFTKRLPPGEDPEEVFETNDDAFLEGVRQLRSKSKKEVEADQAAKSRIVSLQPLNDEQIKRFATAKGIDDADALLLEIRRREAWTFARRPLDLAGLVRSWKAHRRIGTKLEQHESDVAASLKDSEDRNAAWMIPPDLAREGAERLALAIALTKTRTIRVPGSEIEAADGSMLDPEIVLSDWKPADREALLRLPIFDVATFGRVRFHHRSVAEYLAACRLAHLKANGLSKRGLMRLLFAERYGELVVIPSMRPIAAWLAGMDNDVLEELLRRQPEVLISFGDAESLPLEARSSLLRHYVAAYSSGGWRGLDLSINDVQRLAQADLAEEVRNLWAVPINNEEVLVFLLKLIWLAPIIECADLAFDTVMNADLGTYPRVLALHALAESKRTDLLRLAADDMLANPERWPPEVMRSTPSDLFPHVVSTAELLQILTTVPQGRDEVGGFSWSLHNLVDGLEAGSEGAVSLRRGLADLVWEHRTPDSTWYQANSAYNFLAPALTKLCLNELKRGQRPDSALVRDTAIANRFHGDRVLAREEKDKLAKQFEPGSIWRELAFLAELDIARGLSQGDEQNRLIFYAMSHGLIKNFDVLDWGWIFDRLKAATDEMSAGLYFSALQSCPKPADWADQLRQELKRWPALAQRLEDQLAPRPPNPEYEEMVAEGKKHAVEAKQREDAIAESWLQLRRELEEMPGEMFGPERLENTRWNLVRWVMDRSQDSSSRITPHRWGDVRKMLGDEVGDRFEQSCRDYWKAETPETWSTKDEDKRNSSSGRPYVALTGLSIESSVSGWADALTPEQVERAAGWATTELNGHPEWIDDLAKADPEAVARALTKELDLELALAATLPYPKTLSAVAYGSFEVMQVVAPALRRWLIEFDPASEPEEPAHLISSLDRVRGILSTAYGSDGELAALMKSRFLAKPEGALALTWLRGLVANDPDQGIGVLRQALKLVPFRRRRQLGLSYLASLFGDRRLSGGSVALPMDAAALKSLAIIAFDCIRREDDVTHEGVYSPGERDDAEDARNRILNALVNLPGHQAYEALVAMAKEPLFAHMPDRLRALARERAASDSEVENPFTANQVRAWEGRYERPPQNADELFDVAADRLDDMEFDLVHHDFGFREQLERLTGELEVQPHIARYFHEHARGQYTVTREPEVAERKRRDVQLAATAFTGKATVELKIGDKWTFAQLNQTLRDQIIARYLRHPENSVGFLLVTFAGHKKKRFGALTFEQVIEKLKEHASDLEREYEGKIRLGVVGLDLRPPGERDALKPTKGIPIDSLGEGSFTPASWRTGVCKRIGRLRGEPAARSDANEAGRKALSSALRATP